MKLFFRLLLCLLVLGNAAFSQNLKVTLSGHVRDSTSGENLPGATVSIPALQKGMNTNTYGFYSLTLAPGTYTVKVSYIGFEAREITVKLNNDQVLDVDMVPRSMISKEIIIKDVRRDENVKEARMGMHQLSVESIKKLPVIMGEVDIMKSLQLLPGVSSAGEGQNGFYVRGGGPDQNLILLDDAVVYNTGHLFGFFSVFNGDALKNVTLIKGAAPANYGGRLSSVVDVSMKEGNNKKYQVEGGLGLIASRLSIQGPIIKNKASFIISGRRTYVDALTRPFVKSTSPFKGSGYYFYDLNAKVNYIIGKKDRLYLSSYLGKDVFTFKNKESNLGFSIPWGNKTAALRWNHEFSNKLFLNTSLVYNDYNFTFGADQQDFKVKFFSGIRDWSIKSDLDFYTRFNHNFKFGGIITHHKFTPSTLSGEAAGAPLNPDQSFTKFGIETAAYVVDEFDLGKKLKVNAGLRYSGFLQMGPYTRYTWNDNDVKTDSVTYASGEQVTSYGGLEPRLNLRYSLNESTSLKGAVAKTYQYIHLVTNNGSTLPTDIWSPSSYFVQPQKAWQYSLGVFKNWAENKFETSVEVYYKDMRNLSEYREGYTPSSLRDIDYDLVFGRGYAYGAEFYLNKTKGRWTGWLSYTLAWTWRDFKALNGGDPYLTKYDQRHNIAFTSAYELNKKWTLSTVFVYGSGNRVTLPVSLYVVNGQLVQHIENLNNYRLPSYHRWDLGAVYTPTPKPGRKWKSSWTFSVYNVYSRMNPYIIYLNTQGNINDPAGIQLQVKQISIFPILPSVTYNFKFN
jgi:hypothetical protein